MIVVELGQVGVNFIFNQAACLLLHPTKPYRGVNFPYQHFLSAVHLDATELFQSWISEALQSWRYYYRYTSYCTQGNFDVRKINFDEFTLQQI